MAMMGSLYYRLILKLRAEQARTSAATRRP